MIIEALHSAGSFSESERTIASYILAHGDEIRTLSISRLAEETFSSPATITRLCRKVGTEGYKDFRIRFNTEWERGQSVRHIDINLPFGVGDSPRQIARSMANLQQHAVQAAMERFDYRALDRIVNRLDRSDVVNIYTMGNSLPVALEFKIKMVRLGRQVNVEQDSSILPGYAFASGKKTFNLLISHSGETRRIVECAQILRENGSYSVALTSSSRSTVAKLCNEVICTQVSEGDLYSAKIETFATVDVTHYILDCLYCWLFQKDHVGNMERSRRSLRGIRDFRMGQSGK